MTIQKGECLGMPVEIPELDGPNQQFFSHCGRHELHLQRCDSCQLLRYPATNACPFCASFDHTWAPVSGKGTLYSYGEVHHAIQPSCRKASGTSRGDTQWQIVAIDIASIMKSDGGRYFWSSGGKDAFNKSFVDFMDSVLESGDMPYDMAKMTR